MQGIVVVKTVIPWKGAGHVKIHGEGITGGGNGRGQNPEVEMSLHV